MNVIAPLQMHFRRRAAWAVAALLLPLALPLVGCNKMLATHTINRAQKRVEEAQQNEAARFASDLLSQATAKITEATSLLNAGQAREARVAARDAAELSQQLLRQTKEQRANALRDEAYRWLDIARKNGGNSENPQLYDQVFANNERGVQQLSKQKYDNAIRIFLEVIDGVQYLLRNLETAAKQGLTDAEAMLEELRAAGAEEFAPEYIETLSNQIQQMRDLINTEVNYRQAIDKKLEAQQTKEIGLRETNRAKSLKLLTELESLLQEAQQLGAEIYVSQDFLNISREYRSLWDAHFGDKFQTVLTAGPNLKPRIEALILETKRAAAEAGIQTVQRSIRALEDMKVRTYLVGRLETLETRLQEARTLYDQQQYIESRRVSDDAMESYERILVEFDALAQQEINRAQEALAGAEGVMATMESIFSTQVPGDWTGEEKALEDSKLALQQELLAKLNGARVNVGLAALRRNEKAFDQSIETARLVQATAEEVVQQTYRVVAHNAILELANQLTRHEREGGREFAAAEVDKAHAMLEETKTRLREGQYRDAVRQAAATKAQLEIVAQELVRVAVQRIEAAGSAIEQARRHRAEQYQSQGLNQALVTLDTAMAALEGGGSRQAIEAAERARQIAQSVYEQSLRQWVAEDLNRCDLLLRRAREAGAMRYAPSLLHAAEAQRAALQRLFDQGDYAAAIGVSAEAVQSAEDALYALVTEAENRTAIAQRFEGWEFEGPRMAQAIALAKTAREQLDAGRYREAEVNARQAIELAQAVAVSAKRKSFEDRLGRLRAMIDQAEKQGPGLFQIRDLAAIMAEMGRLRREFDPKSLDDFNQPLDLLEARLGALAELTPQVLEQVTTRMETDLAALEERGARDVLPDKVELVRQKVRFARLDFRNARYRASFLNVRDAQRALDEMARTLDERDFDLALLHHLSEFNDAINRFHDVLALSGSTLIQLAIGPTGRTRAVALLQSSSPTDLREAITEIGAAVARMTPPPSRADVHQRALQMLNLAKTSAINFEKLTIMDQFSPTDARAIIQAAYMQMSRARAEQQRLQAALTSPLTVTTPVVVQRVGASEVR